MKTLKALYVLSKKKSAFKKTRLTRTKTKRLGKRKRTAVQERKKILKS